MTPPYKFCEHENHNGIPCGVQFYPGNGMKPQNWKQAKNCKKHRKGGKRIPGACKVKNATIDWFLTAYRGG